MGWLNKLLDRFSKRQSIENPAVPINQAIGYLGAGTSRSGMVVTSRTSLTYSPVWSAVDIISGDVAKLPFITYRRIDERTKEVAYNHPTFAILRQYTGEMSANQWLVLMMSQALLHGNAYARIWRDGANRPEWLEWLPRRWVVARRLNGTVVYQIYRDGLESRPELPIYETLTPDDVFHLPGLLYDSQIGLSLIEFARNTVGRQLAAEGYTDDFFANGAQPGGIMVHPTQLSDPGRENLRRQFEAVHKGVGKTHRLAVFDEGVQYTRLGVTPEEALLVDNLNLGVKDVARFFTMPSHKLGDDSKTSYNSIEQENRSYLDSTLMSWLSKLENEANLKLFSPREVRNMRFFAEFDTNRLLRADLQTRVNAGATAVQNKLVTPNEWRQREGLNPLPGGDEFQEPPPPPSPAEEPPPGEDSSENSQEDARNRLYELLRSSGGRMCLRVARGVRTAARRPERVPAYIDDIPKNHRSVVADNLEIAIQLAFETLSIDSDPDAVIDDFIEMLQTKSRFAAESGWTLEDTETELARASDEFWSGLIFGEELCNV